MVPPNFLHKNTKWCWKRTILAISWNVLLLEIFNYGFTDSFLIYQDLKPKAHNRRALVHKTSLVSPFRILELTRKWATFLVIKTFCRRTNRFLGFGPFAKRNFPLLVQCVLFRGLQKRKFRFPKDNMYWICVCMCMYTVCGIFVLHVLSLYVYVCVGVFVCVYVFLFSL